MRLSGRLFARYVCAVLLLRSGGLAAQEVAAADVSAPATTEHRGTVEVTPEVRADILVARRQYMEAIRLYGTISDPSAVVLNKLGIAYEHMRMYPEARQLFQRALLLNPKLPGPENNLATVLYVTGDLRHAEQHYKRALKLDPRSASTLNNLGTLYFTRQKVHKGMEAYQQALSLDPMIFEKNALNGIQTEGTRESRAMINYYLAQTCAQAGQTAAALLYLRKAIDAGFHDRAKLENDHHFDRMRGVEELRTMGAEMRERPVEVAKR